MSKVKRNQWIAFSLLSLATAFTIVILLAILFYVMSQGLQMISWEFLTENPRNMGAEGGIYPAILGTIYLVGTTLLIATPIGVGTAIYLNEYTREGPFKKTIRFTTEALAGIPSIVFGLFGFVFFVILLEPYTGGWSILSAGEITGATRSWQFGDVEPWNVTRTITNAITRTVSQGDDPGSGLRLEVEDVEIQETEARTQAAVVLLVDTSFSMAAENRWVPMKRTALALHQLISTRFRGDELQLIHFGRYANQVQVEELTAMAPFYEQGTNLHHGLLLATRFFRKHPSMRPVLLIVTDGEPTAHLLPTGESMFSYPPRPDTLHATVAELDRVSRMSAEITFFRLGDDPGLKHFLEAMARRVDGKVVAPDVRDLGAAVVGEFLHTRRPNMPFSF